MVLTLLRKMPSLRAAPAVGAKGATMLRIHKPWCGMQRVPARWALATAALAALMSPAARATDVAVEPIHAITAADGEVLGRLVVGPDGALYGTSYLGSNGKGAVFRLDAAGRYRVLHDFDGADGEIPRGLTAGPDGQLYGVAFRGGQFGWGSLYRVSPEGRFKLLHSFSHVGQDGGSPNGRLLLASDGQFYGTTSIGGAWDAGTVFRMNRHGEIKVLHEFGSIDHDGGAPNGELTEGSDGLIYGTTLGGGEECCGTVYKMHRNGEMHVLHSFWFDGRDGYSPDSGVTEGPDGRFYGVVDGHRLNRRGLIYRVDRRGEFEIVYDFPGPEELNGREPQWALTLGRDGRLYGSTSTGGAHSAGTLFQLNTDGTLTTLYHFDGSSKVGSHADNPLVEVNEGEFIGTTLGGGKWSRGSIYRMSVSPAR